MSDPMFHVWISSFGEFRLADSFVAAAKAKWPGKHKAMRINVGDGPEYYETTEPKWVDAVHDGLERLALKCWTNNINLRLVKSLDAIA